VADTRFIGSTHLLLEHDLAQAQKLESIGQLAAGIAHEINTPTQFVGDNIRFLSDAFTDLLPLLDRSRKLLVSAETGVFSPDVIEACDAALATADLDYVMTEIPRAIAQSADGIDRIGKIVRAMKDFAHPDTDELTCANLNDAITSTVTVSRNEWKYVAELTTELDPDLPLIPCRLGEINQVLLNLIVNAAHAIGDTVKGTGQKGLITISSRRVGEWAEIRVTDTGTGIPENIRHRIFDPFFTTKEVGRGTGQGLAISRSIVVDKHGGSIAFDTQVGKGTTFIVRLPVGGAEPVHGATTEKRAA
jgi:signal transduction histidine kinase